MSKIEARKLAKKYLEDQAAIIRKHGESPKLRGHEYKAALDDTTKLFQSLSRLGGRKTD